MIEYWIDDVPVDGPETDAALEKAQADAKQGKELRKAIESDTIGAESKEPPANAQTAAPGISTKAGGDVKDTARLITKIDSNVYGKVASGSITTENAVITTERIEHIKERHPGDWERYGHLIQSTIDDPDYILADNNPNTAICIRRVEIEKEIKHLRTTLRLHVDTDEAGRENSVLTFQKINAKEYGRLSRNRKVVYKKE